MVPNGWHPAQVGAAGSWFMRSWWQRRQLARSLRAAAWPPWQSVQVWWPVEAWTPGRCVGGWQAVHAGGLATPDGPWAR